MEELSVTFVRLAGNRVDVLARRRGAMTEMRKEVTVHQSNDGDAHNDVPCPLTNNQQVPQ
jgi:hypothetical protein